jgi:uncharacterized membrane protein YqjE
MAARPSAGLIGDVSALAAGGLRAVRTRLELLTIELSEEKAWVVRLIVVAIGAVYLVSFGTLLAVLAVSLAMPEASRPAVLGGFAALMLVTGIAAIAWTLVSAKHRAPPFQDTIATLRRDEGVLGEAGGE